MRYIVMNLESDVYEKENEQNKKEDAENEINSWDTI